uniref:Staphylococcal nuclease domain-containing protein 1 n=1 Tax=Hemiscolopendra marginata TaxID=943146 RepID=A0A646QDV8_9MYRI
MSAVPSNSSPQRGIVKQVLSGDTVIIRGVPKAGPPPEKSVSLSHITAPRLGRRPANSSAPEIKDEPYAWEAREFLRKKLIGQEVTFVIETTSTARNYGYIFLGKDTSGENIAESIVAEGLVDVRENAKPSEELKRLIELKKQAESAGKGKFNEQNPQEHVRDIKWTIDNPANFVDALHGNPVKAIIENVRDGGTVRAFLLPEFQYVTVMMTGIRCQMFKFVEEKTAPEPEQFAAEAKYCTESRLLHRDVEITFHSVNNNNFFGSIHHPQGNIAEVLLREGFARCVDWTLSLLPTGKEKLKVAEKIAMDKRLRIWKDYVPPSNQIDTKSKEFTGKVAEVVNADALVIKLADNSLKKIFLSSIQLPRSVPAAKPDAKETSNKQKSRLLYDVPYMYEAREFLRQKLIGKKVNVTVDYKQPPSNSRPERICCTVTIGGMNVAEAMVSKGLASVIRYRQDDDQRSSHYNDLLAAENKAMKSKKGIHSKKEAPTHRVADVSGDYTTAKQFFPFLQRAGRSDGVVEYVASGSRLRLYIPRETCLITFLLAGINCPKPTRVLPNGTTVEGEAWGEEALNFTKDLCMQKEVEVEIESMDKAGNFIGWLWIDSKNLSVALVEEGLASVHFTAERSSHFRALQIAETTAKDKHLNLWNNYEEPKEIEIKDEAVERVKNYKSVIITDFHRDFHFYAQHTDQGPQLEQMTEGLRQELATHPPVVGAYNPKKGEICAAKFTDDEWYRAKIEKIQGKEEIHIIYIDYGNIEVTKSTRLAALPSMYHGLPPFAHEYALACVVFPDDVEYQDAALIAFKQDVENQILLLNTEYRGSGFDYVTLLLADSQEDIGKALIEAGLLTVEKRKEKRLKKLIEEYEKAQEVAKKNRVNQWCYGDFMDDEAKEFGYRR